MSNGNSFLFITNDVPKTMTETISALDVCDELLTKHFWAFTEQAPLKNKLSRGDRALIYVAGAGRRFFYASCVIDSPLTTFEKGSLETRTLQQLGLGFMKSGIHLRDIRKFAQPIPILPLLNELGFIKDKRNYGLHLRLPIARIPDNEFDLLLNQPMD